MSEKKHQPAIYEVIALIGAYDRIQDAGSPLPAGVWAEACALLHHLVETRYDMTLPIPASPDQT